MLLKNDKPFAAVFIECHSHSDSPEVYFTVILGGWNTDSYKDHVTFACRYGAVMYDELGCTLIDVPDFFDEPIAGTRLNRTAALEHSRVGEFWNVVDYMLEEAEIVQDYMLHPKNYIITLAKHYLRQLR